MAQPVNRATGPNPATRSGLRALLDTLGKQPIQKLGQNFLIDANILAKTVAFGDLQRHEAIIEIGPGLGVLTEALLLAGCRVFAIERDTVLFHYLKSDLLPRFPDTLHLCHGDAVDEPRAGWLPGDPAGCKIIANLPYAISTPWLEKTLRGPLPGRLVLMLQKEAAERFIGAPGTRAYGAISIFLQSAYDAETSHRVSPRCFYPVPDVDSMLMVFARKTKPYLFHPDTRALIRRAFTFRRKQIRAVFGRLDAQNLFQAWERDSLRPAKLAPETRAETIPLVCWQDLDKLLRNQLSEQAHDRPQTPN